MNRVLVTIGPFAIYWYSVLILIAIIVGYLVADKYNQKLQMPSTLITDMLLGIVLSALVGARAYYVIFNFASYKDNLWDIFKIWEGGLAIYGAIIAGAIYVFNYCYKAKISFIKVCDVCSLSLLLGQAIGRWGNFFNSEAYGSITAKKFLQSQFLPDFIIEGMYIDNAYRLPTFLYESIWCFIGVIILYLVRRGRRYHVGRQTAFYLIWYGVGRFFIESLRTDSLYLGSLKISQIVSIMIVIAGFVILLCSRIANGRRKVITSGGMDINGKI